MTQKKNSKVLTLYKATRSSGHDFYTGEWDYAKALQTGEPLIHPDPQGPTNDCCGRGFHVSDTPRKTCKFLNSSYRPYRWFQVEVEEQHVIQHDDNKHRVSQLRVVKELTLTDIFGPDFGARIERVLEEIKTWKKIPWLKPKGKVTDAELHELFTLWHKSISPWRHDKNKKLPTAFLVIRDRKTADAAAVAADAAADDVAAAVAADAADAAAVAADAAAVAADAADAAAAVAADVAAAADVALRFLPWWFHWYVRPYHVLRRMARWELAGLTEPNPWTPLAAMYRLGALPLGYRKVEGKTVFAVYLPK